MMIAGKKVTELITSSAQKKTSAGVLSKKTRDTDVAKIGNSGHVKVAEDQRMHSRNGRKFLDQKIIDGRNNQCALDTMFSPAFHITNDVNSGVVNNGTLASKNPASPQDCRAVESKAHNLPYPLISRKEQNVSSQDGAEDLPTDSTKALNRSDSHNSCERMPLMEANLNTSFSGEHDRSVSSEFSSVYFSVQSSKLECVELCQESSSTEGDIEEDGIDEIDDFDPYLFIRNLPDLSAVVPTFRPLLLPKQTRSCPSTTLVLDLDETLVHSTLEPCEDVDFTFPVSFNFKEHTVYVRCRPYLKDFFERISVLFEIIIFTASQSIYAERLLNVLDPKRRIFRHRVYRESCVFVDGNYLKDLSVLGRDLARVIIVDNSPQAFGFQVDNGIPIQSWFDDRSDEELLRLIPFLESLIGVEDVRPLIANKFNLRQKIAATAAVPQSLVFSE